MFKRLIQSYKDMRTRQKFVKIMSTPESQLALLEAGYKKFSVNLSERERTKMKREMNRLRKLIRIRHQNK